jgi:NTE family protein
MRSILRRSAVLLVVLVFVGGMVWAATAPAEVLNNSNDLLAAGMPILYGDAQFRQRILDRTRGEREPVGLVLSGGSARAFAHIGVLRYLEELGIVPDYIISNSMGSIVGLLYAAGLSPQQILTVCSSVDLGELFDLTLPLAGGLLSTPRFSALIAAYLGDDLRLETLPIPIMVVSEDLATKRQIQIMEGDFITVLEASFVLPIYFSPVEYQGHLLLDGGITNLVPLDIAYNYSDKVIVSTTFYEGKDTNLRNSLVILNTAIDIAKRRQGVLELLQHPEAIWIRCEVEDFSFMDFSSMLMISQKGYASAKEQENALSALDAGGTTETIRSIRAQVAARQDKVLGNYKLYNRLDQKRFSQYTFLTVRSFEYPDDPWKLREETLIGATYQMRWRTISLSIDGGMGWNAFTPMETYPSATVSLSANPFPFLVLNTDLSVSWDQGWMPSYYNRVNMEARQRYFEDQLTVRLLASLENQLTPAFTLQEMVLSVGANLGWQNAASYGFSGLLEAGWQLTGRYNRPMLYAKSRTSLPLLADFELKLGVGSRFALDGQGDVPFFTTDGFRTVKQDIQTQGSASASEVNPANHLITASIDVTWIPSAFKPTIGELLIFHDTGIGAYGQFLWYRQEQPVPEVSVGLEVGSRISLLGLKSLQLKVFAGYDMLSDQVVWGFVFGK